MMKISPYKSFFKAALTLSFDYETSAISQPSRLWQRLYRYYLEQTNSFRNSKKKTSYGNSQRLGAEMIFTALQEQQLHATWFGTGHTLLPGNTDRKEYRINQTLPSDPHASRWREKRRIFDDDPFTTYKKRSDYYFGDLTKKLKEHGEDIQCHTFSHPQLALEPLENIAMDLEDWQNTAVKHGYNKAQVLAFPFLGDSCYFHQYLQKKTAYPIKGEQWEIESISPDRLDVIHSSGIELVTRCGSKQNEKPFKAFKPYNDSSLFYMADRPMNLNDFNKEKFDEKVREMIQNGWMIDYWCHPHNIYEYPYENFIAFLSVITRYRDTDELWVPTIKEAWDHFKTIQNIDLSIDQTDNGVLRGSFFNNNDYDVTDIGIDIDLNKHTPLNLHGIGTSGKNSDRIVLNNLPSKKKIQLEFRINNE